MSDLPPCDRDGDRLHRWACALATEFRKRMILERVEAAWVSGYYDTVLPDRDGLWRDDGGLI